MNVHTLLTALEPEIYNIYHTLHENPELGLQEYNTSRLIKKEILDHNDCDELISIGETGLIAVLEGEKQGNGPTLLLRADMDALPVQEDGAHIPKSRNEGVMHACGHDAHTAMLLGALRILKSYKKYFSGTVYFFFQPAEEIMAGAKLLLNSNIVDLNTIDGVAACHVIPDLYAGDIGLKSGPVLAGADEIEITVTGKGGHGAHPYTTVDPIHIAMQTILQFEGIMAREVNALDSAVISICSIHSDGDIFNVIPDNVRMKGTLRAVDKETRNQLKTRITEVCNGVAQSSRGKVKVTFQEGPPPLSNDQQWVEGTKKVCSRLLGQEHVKEGAVTTMGAEDFAYIKERYPGVFVRIGCRSPEKEFTPIHSSKFTVDRKALSVGILTYCGISFDFFGIGDEIYG